MKEFDQKTENGDLVVTNHKRRPGEELRLKFSDFPSGKAMEEVITRWADRQ